MTAIERDLIWDCPDGEVCKRCPCAGEDDVCFPGERLRAEVVALRQRVDELLEAENKAWREAEMWKDRAVERSAVEALRTLCQAIEGEERPDEMPTALALSLRQARAVVAASTRAATEDRRDRSPSPGTGRTRRH